MKKQLIFICIVAAVLQSAREEKWEPTTHECSLEFPDGSWTLQKGRDFEHGQIILSADNREQTKTIAVFKYQVAPSFSVQDPRFVAGVTNGFAKSGYRLLNAGYTNINGYTAHWLNGEAFDSSKKVSTLRYALCANGRLYQLVGQCIGDSALNDKELIAILTSFQINTKALLPSAPVSSDNSLAYRIGLITGFLLVLVLVLGLILRSRSKRQTRT